MAIFAHFLPYFFTSPSTWASSSGLQVLRIFFWAWYGVGLYVLRWEVIGFFAIFFERWWRWDGGRFSSFFTSIFVGKLCCSGEESNAMGEIRKMKRNKRCYYSLNNFHVLFGNLALFWNLEYSYKGSRLLENKTETGLFGLPAWNRKAEMMAMMKRKTGRCRFDSDIGEIPGNLEEKCRVWGWNSEGKGNREFVDWEFRKKLMRLVAFCL